MQTLAFRNRTRPCNSINHFSKLSSLTFYSNLRSSFSNITLYLLSYSSGSTTTDNLEDQLKAWLIGVTVVLGSLCITLLVGFIIKLQT